MNDRPPPVEQRLDELYREHPEGFIAGRDRLVKELRAAGDGDAAGRLKKLRRPTVAAWLINRAALDSPAKIQEFAEVSRELEDAQGRALEGRDDAATEWRAAAAREREVAGSIVELADAVARDGGHPASKRTLELVAETLRAAAADPGLREHVARGRVERERSAATLGTPAAVLPHRPRPRSERRREVAQANRELKRLQDELAAATAREQRLGTRVEQTAEALRQEKTKLAESRRVTAELQRQVKAAGRRAGSQRAR